MPDLNVNRKGYIVGQTASTQAAARDVTTGSAVEATGGVAGAIQYFASPGRGGGTYRYIRTFFHFDTSGITSALTSAILHIPSSGSSNDSDVVVVASDAFGGNGSALADTHFPKLDFGVQYSSALSTWNSGGSNNTITLNSTARSAITSSNHFICAVIDSASDLADEDPLEGGSGDLSVGINFGGTIKIAYVLAGYSESVYSVSSSGVDSIIGAAPSAIEKVIGA